VITKIKDIDILCEALRDISFKESLGCYDCFDLEYGFCEVTDEELRQNFKERCDLKDITLYYNPEYNLWTGWYWDGDGTLLFRFNGKYYMNTDCKKTCDWKEVPYLTLDKIQKLRREV